MEEHIESESLPCRRGVDTKQRMAGNRREAHKNKNSILYLKINDYRNRWEKIETERP